MDQGRGVPPEQARMAKPNLYLESSIISYQVARPSRDVITLARQRLTHDWWDRRRQDFHLYISQIVLDEVGAGDKDAASRRIAIVREVPLLGMSPEVIELAQSILKSARLPEQAGADALHIAIAAFNGMDYLLTWNSKHIANAEYRHRVEQTCRRAGFEPPVLCTPDELMGGDSDES